MREIIERDGRFYIQETVENGEVTMESLKENLAQIKAQKEELLKREEAQFDKQIDEVESDIDALKELQEKPAQRKARGRTSKAVKT